jgi:hypothetical protein
MDFTVMVSPLVLPSMYPRQKVAENAVEPCIAPFGVAAPSAMLDRLRVSGSQDVLGGGWDEVEQMT